MIAADVVRRPWPGAPPAVPHARWAALITQALAAVRWTGRAYCGLRGHLMVRKFEPHRMSLECMRCGECTAGWTVAGE